MRTPEALGRALAEAPDPEMARTSLARLEERGPARELLGDPVILERALPLIGFSSAVVDFLSAHPDEVGLFASIEPRDRAALEGEAATDVDTHGASAGLRRFRRRALARTAARDLAGASLEEVVAEITHVAEVALDVAVRETGSDRLAVIGMGKLGGRELNYSSDVDVVFVHPDAGGDAQQTAAAGASAVVALLSQTTAEGVALRVDTSLRPEGRAGPLSRSLASTLEYYARHAATWERQAMLKARAVAGDVDLGGSFVDQVAPIVFPEYLEASAIDDVRHSKVRIEEYVRASGKDATSVKRGRGGIRDVEFSVQLLQLVHGRRDARLRDPNTLTALETLAEEGYVAREDAAALAESYRFLRTVEHRLQVARDLQTHELPSDRGALARIARSMGMRGPGELSAAYERQTATVRGLHERLFYRPLLEAFAGRATPAHGTDREATEELLVGLGFRDPGRAFKGFERVIEPGARLGKVLAHVFPVVAPALALSADPDAALVRFERVSDSLRGHDDLADAIASDPRLARGVALVAAASTWLTDLLASRPQAVRALGEGGNGEPDERLLRVGAAHAAGERRVPDVGRDLAAIADAVVAAAVEAARPAVPIAVVGLGKLGGEELNFGSDLDVVFVFEGEGPDAFVDAERAAERILAGIAERGFEADADLRPEGKSGPLARSVAAYLEYWERWGQTWEFQALLKARHVAGDEMLGRRFVSLAGDVAFPEHLSLDRVAEIRRMRVRMERERVRPADARRFHFKLGYGGLADVSFSVELEQMRHGAEHPDVRTTNTLDALEALAEARLLEDSVSLALGEAYVFLNEVKNALEIDRRIHAEAIPPEPEAQVALARRLGYEEYPRQRFLEDYRRVTRRARRAMERVFYGDEV